MKFYTEEECRTLLKTVNLVDIVKEYVELEPVDGIYFGLCPFHDETSASFMVEPNRQIYKCFGCGETGNAISFISKIENLSVSEAIEFLAGKIGLKIGSEKNKDYEDAIQNRIRIAEINNIASKFYQNKLMSKNGGEALKYFTDRGIKPETIKEFGLGYTGRFSGDLLKFLKARGYSEDDLLKTGLFGVNEKGLSEKFWNRVMFTIYNESGDAIGFGGRITDNNKNTAKYINSPETALFLKGDNLFALDKAQYSDKNYFLLCEGYMDVISLHQAGFDNAVASLGTALTEHQAKKISNYVKEVVITYDSDDAGIKAAHRAISILNRAGIRSSVLNMKPYKDPDEFINALGRDEYVKRISEAEDALHYLVRMEIDKNPSEKLRHISFAAATMNILGYSTDDKNVEKICNDFKFDIGAFKYELLDFEMTIGLSKDKKELIIGEDPVLQIEILRERQLLHAMIYADGVFESLYKNLSLDNFAGREEKMLFNCLCKDFDEIGFIVENSILERAEQSGISDIELIFKDVDTEYTSNSLAESFLDIKRYLNHRQMETAIDNRDLTKVTELIAEEKTYKDMSKQLIELNIGLKEGPAILTEISEDNSVIVER